jgi:hypothetical protein
MPSDLDDQIDAWAAEMPSDTREIRTWVARMPEIRSSAPPADRVVFKTIEQPVSVVAQAEQTDTSDAWNAWATAHCDLVREEMNGLADEAGAMVGKLERRVQELERRNHELEMRIGYEERLRELETKLARLGADLDADHSRTAAPLIPLKGGRGSAA